jgi:alpha-tubulin suppressor-like RCC1 family protein
MALKKDGTLWGWAFERNHRNKPSARKYFKQIGKDKDWSDMLAASGKAFGIKKDGSLWMWKLDGNSPASVPVRIGKEKQWMQAAGFAQHTLLLDRNGKLMGLGYNNSGQIGDGTRTDCVNPTAVAADSEWLQVTGGPSHSAAIKKDGTLWAWGDIPCSPSGAKSAAYQQISRLILGAAQ